MSRKRHRKLISAIRAGQLKRVQQLILSFGIPTVNDGYVSLVHATQNKQTEIVKLLLLCGCKVNVENNQSTNTPLHFAVINRDVEIVKMLLGECADTNAKGEHGQTPLHNAVDRILNLKSVLSKNKHCQKESEIVNLVFSNCATITILKLLLSRGANANARTINGSTALHVAIEKHCRRVVEILLKYNADVNAVFDNGTPLHLAVKTQDTDICKMLLNKGANVNIETTELGPIRGGYLQMHGITPLFIAVQLGEVRIAEDLLNHGAHVNALCTSIEGDNLTALHFAIEKPHEEIVKLLLKHGANVDAPYKDGKTILHHIVELLWRDGDVIMRKTTEKGFHAMQHTYLKIAEELLKSGAAINVHSQIGTALLFVSAADGNSEVTTMLLNKGINVNVKQNELTALHIACTSTRYLMKFGTLCETPDGQRQTPYYFTGNRVIEILLKFGADINSKDTNGRTALHIASKLGRSQFVNILLEYGSDINIVSQDNCSPLDDAVSCFDTLTVQILKEHILKRDAANQYITKKNLQLASTNDLIKFYCDCKKEVERMRMRTICKENKTTFYSILTGGVKQWTLYAGNENIIQVLQTGDYKNEFPIYASLIENHFKRGQMRQPLLTPSVESLDSLFQRGLPQLFIDEVFSYLSDRDLQNLIKASPNTNIADITFN